MSISLYQAAVPPLVQTLQNLAAILAKGAAHAEAKKIDPAVFLNSRLFPDMFPLTRQVQVACDISRRGVARLAGVEAPAMEDKETSFAELISRVDATIAYLQTFAPEQFIGAETKEITLPVGQQTLTFVGLTFLQGFVLSNAYFHVSTAYNILRHGGVELGKADFLGKIQ
jgi:uncharacterized protein